MSCGYKNHLLVCKRGWLSLESALCSNSIYCSNRLYSSLILPRVWKFLSNSNTVHDTYASVKNPPKEEGRFVSDQSEANANLKNNIASKHIEAYINGMRDLGLSNDEIIDAIKNYFIEEEK